MDLTPALIAAFASLIAAGLAASVSLVVTVLAKEQKTSEFRQQWIDSLRADIAEWLGETVMLYSFATMVEGDAQKDDLAVEQRYKNLVSARVLLARIELRLNPKEHQGMLSAMNALRSARKDGNADRRDELVTGVMVESQKLLKGEWEQVKRGEPAFVTVKTAAIAIVGFAIATVGVLVYRAW